MKFMMIFISLIMVITGCSIRNIDAPPAQEYEIWHNPDANELEVKKAILECGLPDFRNGFEFNEPSHNTISTFGFCMEKAGFKAQSPASNACHAFKNENLPICQPGAIIPNRSVSKRLNSAYCKKYRSQNLPVCQP